MNAFRLLLVSLAVALVAASAAAQEPTPSRLRWAGLERGDEIDLLLAWRFREGNDPAFSAPSLDDRDWEIVRPRMPRASRPRGGWTGEGWFRRHVIVDEPFLSNDVVLSIEAPGRARVFLDGQLVMDTGRDATAGRRSGQRYGAWTRVRFGGAAAHLIAVHYVCECRAPLDEIGFQLSMEKPDATASRTADMQRDALIDGAFTAIPAVLGILHLSLFFYYRRARENLFCGACMLSLALIVGASVAQDVVATESGRVAASMTVFVGVIAATFFGVLTYAFLRVGSVPRTWKGFAFAGVLVLAIIPFVESTPQNALWSAYFVASLIEVVRLELKGRSVERESALPLLVGMLLLDAAIVAQILILFGVIPEPFGFDSVYLFGVLAFSLATSLFVARSFARTSVNLERRLDEVQTLSAQVIATERESARRGLEIEAARTLQRSILPSSVPQFANMELAASVTTASEVGGDYYDFREAGDDAVIVALGDAAGHGVAAGAMVTATKALFSAMAGEEDLTRILTECDRVLRHMNVRPLHMCLLLARVTPGGMDVCSAAMPRPLRYVAATRQVEEVEIGGLPLAASLGSSWSTTSVELAPGDVLLFASDGLAEALSPAGEPLGYEGVAARFAEVAADAKAQAVIDSLLEKATEWRGTRAQDDDIALVALRVVTI